MSRFHNLLTLVLAVISSLAIAATAAMLILRPSVPEITPAAAQITVAAPAPGSPPVGPLPEPPAAAGAIAVTPAGTAPAVSSPVEVKPQADAEPPSRAARPATTAQSPASPQSPQPAPAAAPVGEPAKPAGEAPAAPAAPPASAAPTEVPPADRSAVERAAGSAVADLIKSVKPKRFGIGREATPEEIAGWDIDVRPHGEGLPPGSGSAKQGEAVYVNRCAACHGEFGEGAGRWPKIAGGQGSLAGGDPDKTVGSYFPYLSSVFDYVRHAMPFGDAQSLSNDELYAVVAYVLYLNDIVAEDFVLSKETWSQVKMPNAAGFYDDDREEAESAFWNPQPCMQDCKAEVKITGRARVIDVTPQDQGPKKK